jgi:IclR family pca regulon transcriptional regulator
MDEADTPEGAGNDEAARADPNFMTSLARGLAVLQAFSDHRRSLTMAQISHRTGIPRASVRRCLHTLIELGYAHADGNQFALSPKVLTLGYSYLSSTPLTVSAHPYLNQVSRTLNESCSLAVLQDHEVLYVGRSATSRIMSGSLTTGSRLPAYCTALGRVLLAHQPPEPGGRARARLRADRRGARGRAAFDRGAGARRERQRDRGAERGRARRAGLEPQDA